MDERRCVTKDTQHSIEICNFVTTDAGKSVSILFC